MNQFNGDVARRLAVAIGLVNAAASDDLASRPDDLFAEQGYHAPTSPRDWVDVASMARDIAPLLDTVIDDSDAAVPLLNARLGRLEVTPQLERRGTEYQLHFHSTAADFARGWDAGITAALAIALSTGDATRIGRCDATHCRRLFLDRGRNVQRRFCSLRCQNRAKSAAYRARIVER